MMVKKIIIFIIIFVFFSCARVKPPLSPGILSTSYFPGINDKIWSDVETWPRIIKKRDEEYRIKLIQNESETSSIQTYDISEIDKSKVFFARYELITNERAMTDEDYYYGPFFGWRSDGSIFYRSMYDEKMNLESYRYYRNNKIAEMELYDSDLDFCMWILFDKEGKQIGYTTIKNEFSPSKKFEELHLWRGKVVSEKEFHRSLMKFNVKFKGDIVGGE